MVKWISRWFLPVCILLSLFFVVKYYYNIDEFTFLPVINATSLGLSFLFLFIGMICQLLTWHVMLNSKYDQIQAKDSFASFGITVFTKYIPGKVLSVLSRSDSISKKYSLNFISISGISLQTQLLTILIGLLLGFISLRSNILAFVFASSLIISIISLMNSQVMSWVEYEFLTLFKKEITFIRYSLLSILRVIPVFTAFWIFLCIGFYFFIGAFDSISMQGSFMFALAATVGILAIIAPGGLGIREGFLFVALQESGIQADVALSLSLMSRLWFLVGEICMFSIGVVCKKWL